MEGDSHKRSCYEANRNPSFLNKWGHGSEPQWGSLLTMCSHGQELPHHWEKANFPFSSRVKGETGKWRRRRHKQQPNKIFFQELLKQGNCERRRGTASHFQQGKRAGELVKGIFFSENLQLTDSSSDKNSRISGQSLQREKRLCVRPDLTHEHVPL